MVLVRLRMTQPRGELLAESFQRLALLLEGLLVMVAVNFCMTQPRRWWSRRLSVRVAG